MVEHGKIFKCEDCGSIVEVLVDAHRRKKTAVTLLKM